MDTDGLTFACAMTVEERIARRLGPTVRVGLGTANGVPGPKAVIFQGLPDTLTMVSTFSLQGAWRGQPQMLQFLTAPSDEGGGIRLLVNETPYTGPVSGGALCLGMVPDPQTGTPLPQFLRPTPGPGSFVLADHLSYCRFKYLTPSPEPGKPGVWLPVWTGKGWPAGIRIEMAPVAPNAAQLQPVTVTAPIYINRDPVVQYADQ